MRKKEREKLMVWEGQYLEGAEEDEKVRKVFGLKGLVSIEVCYAIMVVYYMDGVTWELNERVRCRGVT